jgi:hypothetical protein
MECSRCFLLFLPFLLSLILSLFHSTFFSHSVARFLSKGRITSRKNTPRKALADSTPSAKQTLEFERRDYTFLFFPNPKEIFI